MSGGRALDLWHTIKSISIFTEVSEKFVRLLFLIFKIAEGFHQKCLR